MAKEKKYTYGTCKYERTSPPKEKISGNTGVVNIVISFEEALKLNVAVDECIRRLNRYNRSTIEGKRAAMNLTVYFSQGRIAVNKGKLSK